jgi:hypothetical protein
MGYEGASGLGVGESHDDQPVLEKLIKGVKCKTGIRSE